MRCDLNKMLEEIEADELYLRQAEKPAEKKMSQEEILALIKKYQETHKEA